MAILHVRNVPDDLYERIKQHARANRRSLGAEVVSILDRQIDRPPQTQAAVSERLLQIRESWTPPPGTPDSVVLLRGDRDR